MSEPLEREIEAVLESRLGRGCVFMPSGRLAIFAAFQLLLSPGDRVLMSPLEDDTVFFGALAAGLRPVMAPVSAHDGNMRVDAVDDATWSTISAVLTGNTYGFPDRVLELSATCGRLGIPLIEDAAHALETDTDGRPVGSFGTVSAFSLSKHFPGRGGVLALDQGVSRGDVTRLRDRLMLPRPAGNGTVGQARSTARQLLESLRLMQGLDRARRLAHPVTARPWRVPLRAPELRHACSSGDLGQFDAWMQTGYPDYRMRQRSGYLRRTLGHLRDLDRDRAERIRGVLRLRELDAAAPAARDGDPLPLLRVPLLIEDRDAVALELRRHGVNVFFLYAPPLDDYSGAEFCDPAPLPEEARWWAAHVLPVDPHDAERVLGLVGKNQIRLTPAARPRYEHGVTQGGLALNLDFLGMRYQENRYRFSGPLYDMSRARLCACGHTYSAHKHYRRGTECSLYPDCRRRRSPGPISRLAVVVSRKQFLTGPVTMLSHAEMDLVVPVTSVKFAR